MTAQAVAGVVGGAFQLGSDLFSTIYGVQQARAENELNRQFTATQNQVWAQLARDLQVSSVQLPYATREQYALRAGYSAGDAALVALGAAPQIAQTWTPSGYKTYTPNMVAVNSQWTSALGSGATRLGAGATALLARPATAAASALSYQANAWRGAAGRYSMNGDPGGTTGVYRPL
uniref:Minor structural protein n=1 Tax=Racaecavirus sp. TaxID=2716751 RepID=A0A6G7PS10_9VIRU|nr:minor structural protein [Racaecavirus sp.]